MAAVGSPESAIIYFMGRAHTLQTAVFCGAIISALGVQDAGVTIRLTIMKRNNAELGIDAVCLAALSRKIACQGVPVTNYSTVQTQACSFFAYSITC